MGCEVSAGGGEVETEMAMRKTMAAFVALAAAAGAAFADPVRIEEARWLAGRWVGEGIGGTFEETWAEPYGGQMVGHFVLLREGRPVLYEILLIDEHEGGLRMRVKHFNPDFVAWEDKDGWSDFAFVSAAPDKLAWDALVLERVDETTITGALTVRHRDGRPDEAFVLRYRRAPL
jgi:hypothetical protein